MNQQPDTTTTTTTTLEGSLLFLERIDKSTSSPEYNSGEYICIRQTKYALYCVKNSENVYDWHNTVTFNIVGNDPWTIVEQTKLPSIRRLAELIIKKAKDESQSQKPSWISGVYVSAISNAESVLRRIHPEDLNPPQYRAWKPDEVPVGALLKVKHDHMVYLILAGGNLINGNVRVCEDNRITTHSLAHVFNNYEHSIDNGKTWQPCGVRV